MLTETQIKLLNEIKECDDISQYKKGDLEQTLKDTLCISCGNCIVGKNYCVETQETQETEEPCDNCMICGCNTCASKVYNIYQEYVDKDNYYKREKELFDNLIVILKESKIGIVKWASILSSLCITSYISWNEHKDIWKKYVLDSSKPLSYYPKGVTYESLDESDKIYFLDPCIIYAQNYHILRILSGLGSL